MRREIWTCDGCEKELPREPDLTMAIVEGRGELSFPFQLCPACFDGALSAMLGPTKRKAFETPTENYRPQLPFAPRVFKERG